MSDSITVRVTLDAYDMASTGRQTQVYAQIPEVARVSWLLPSDMFHRLKDRAWPEVLDVTHDYVTYGGAASNSSTTAAWKAVMEWLRDDANRDAVQAAWEEHEARQHPVARKLLARVAELEAERHTTNEALSDAAEQLRANRDRIAELEAAPTTVYRAEHPDAGITLGHYGTEKAARAHCEDLERRSWPEGTTLAFDWIEDDEDRVAELVVTAGQNEESTTGYIVTALELDSEYDPDGDE